MSDHEASAPARWSDRVVQRRNERQLQLGLDEQLLITTQLPRWEGLPDSQRLALVARLAQLLARAGLIVGEHSA